jgi:hypothetical protein
VARRERSRKGTSAADVCGKLTVERLTGTADQGCFVTGSSCVPPAQRAAQDGSILSTMLSMAMERVEGVVGVGGALTSIFLGTGAG